MEYISELTKYSKVLLKGKKALDTF